MVWIWGQYQHGWAWDRQERLGALEQKEMRGGTRPYLMGLAQWVAGFNKRIEDNCGFKRWNMVITTNTPNLIL
jgi:hypothetical protein